MSYTHGQYFNLHHDAGTLDDEDLIVEMVAPPRIITLFIYLNTLPEGQGHTEFPYLGLSVKPERGCGVLFCNLLPDGTPDFRTSHKANPITDRNIRKVGINIWIGDSSFQSLVAINKEKKRMKSKTKQSTMG